MYERQDIYACAFSSFPFTMGVLIRYLLSNYTGLWETGSIFWLFGAIEARFGHNVGHEFLHCVSDAQSAFYNLEGGVEYILYLKGIYTHD